MAAKTKRKTAISMRNAQLQREPAGRFTVGGIGVAGVIEELRSGTAASRLGERQRAGGGVIIKNFRVAAPLDGGFELAAGFVLTKMLVKQVAEKLLVQGAIGFSFQRLFHLPQQGHVGECCFAKAFFARLNFTLPKDLAPPRNRHLAFLDPQKT